MYKCHGDSSCSFRSQLKWAWATWPGTQRDSLAGGQARPDTALPTPWRGRGAEPRPRDTSVPRAPWPAALQHTSLLLARRTKCEHVPSARADRARSSGARRRAGRAGAAPAGRPGPAATAHCPRVLPVQRQKDRGGQLRRRRADPAGRPGPARAPRTCHSPGHGRPARRLLRAGAPAAPGLSTRLLCLLGVQKLLLQPSVTSREWPPSASAHS